MNLDVDLLMELQYNLPLTATPLHDLAENIGRKPGEVKEAVRGYIASGVVKRYGLNLNYRAFSQVRKAALVGVRAENVSEVADKINRFDEVTVKHNFLRNDRYNVWFTIKGIDVEEIEKTVDRIMAECGVGDYVILPTRRVYKMDVKYDLRKGVSWSNRGLEPKDVPLVKELGLDEPFVRLLESLEVADRPFLKFREWGYGEEETISIIEELMAKGVGRDFSGVLRESRIGFKENGMTVLRIEGSPEHVALKLLERFPQITHLIERIVSEKWNYPVYFMVHATTKDPIEMIRNKVVEMDEVVEARTIYSKRNLREN
jgi:DNA-binding Lrp family transcriptional regulator